MRSVIRCAALGAFALALHAGKTPYFTVLSEDAGAWPAILSSIGLIQHSPAESSVLVARSGALSSAEWKPRVELGSFLIVEGESSLAETFGFRATRERVKVTSVSDVHRPDLPVVWEKGLELPRFEVPQGAEVFARDRWNGAPLVAGLRMKAGAVLWLATPPGEQGYERYPYLISSLVDLGLEPPFRTAGLWAFFDSAYRSRVDLDYFAARWRQSGIAALHVAAWHFFESDPEGDRYLARLIAACHREGILVYAWLELPHVSEQFWTNHPEWREKTAVLQDAQLDWRKLMNLANRDCFRATSAGVEQLLARFDWDGVNLAELYFESLEGAANPARFTPMNDDVRAEFLQRAGFDPIELFGWRKDSASLRRFLDFRSELARQMQDEWLAKLEEIRRRKPDLDIVLTHVDDRFDAGMRDAIGADAARTLPLLDRHSFTFLIEDPATVWNFGPQRYQAIAEKYRPLTNHRDRLAIDLNIVDRYQDVYPTKQQTGVELFQLVHSAAASFPRVALYFENSLLPPDLPILPSALSSVKRWEKVGPKIVVESARGVGIPWNGPALVDGQVWPVIDDATLWLPAGAHTVESSATPPRIRLLRLNADLKAAQTSSSGIGFAYESQARAIAVLDSVPRHMQIDGLDSVPQLVGPAAILLPCGQHVVTLDIQ